MSRRRAGLQLDDGRAGLHRPRVGSRGHDGRGNGGLQRVIMSSALAALVALVAAGCSKGHSMDQALGATQISGTSSPVASPSPGSTSPSTSSNPTGTDAGKTTPNATHAPTPNATDGPTPASNGTHAPTPTSNGAHAAAPKATHSTRAPKPKPKPSPSRSPAPAPTTPAPSGPSTVLLSRTPTGAPGNGGSAIAYISSGGQFVAFESVASNLVPGDTNAVSDIFLWDRGTHRMERISVSNSGQQANGPSHSARGISPDGRYVAFESYATNLVQGDINGTWDVFLRDRAARGTSLVSVNSSGAHGNGPSSDPVVSANGRFVAFESQASNLSPKDTNGAVSDVFLRDRMTNKTSLVSATPSGVSGNGPSSDPRITPDGHFVCFEAHASNVVSGDTNGHVDVFERDLWGHKTSPVSVSDGGQQANGPSGSCRISADGRYVAFESLASNLVQADSNGTWDVFIRDMWTHHTYRVSVSSAGMQGNAFSSDSTLSDDGRWVCFESGASNLVSGDTNGVVDVFCRDRVANTTYRVSVSSTGSQANGASSDPSITGDGRDVVFQSAATDFTSANNIQKDVFLREPLF
jgi:hypothetical protein